MIADDISTFLLSRRARLRPADVGLIDDGRPRRVQGLRREEVAEAAHMSVEYYIRMERGDLSTVSPEMLRSLADALHLDDAERLYLGNLARASRGTEPTESTPTVVTDEVQTVLNAIRTPAWIRNEKMDILAVNAPARTLYSPIFQTIPERPNTARHLYLTPKDNSFWVDRDQYAGAFAAKLRLERAARPHDKDLAALIKELMQTTEFAHYFATGDVALLTHGLKRFRHPDLGRLDVNFETFAVAGTPGQVLSIYTPANDSTAKVLASLDEGD